MTSITTNVDQKLLRTTKFPPEFSQKVDTEKINIPVVKNWAAGEVTKILGFEDDVVLGLLFDLLEGPRHPEIKSLQIQLAGFLGKDAPTFCKELWNLCLSAQQSDTGIPQQLVEAKKLELIQEKAEQERVAQAARRRRDEDLARDRDIADIRFREQRDRGGRRGGRGGRDFDKRARDYSRSPSPPRRRGSDEYRRAPARGPDSYVPSSRGRYSGRDTSRSPRRPLRRSPSPVRSRSRSATPERSYARRDNDSYRGNGRRRERSPPPRRRSPLPRRRSGRDRLSTSASPSPPRAKKRDSRRDQSRSRSRTRRRSDREERSPPSRRRSPSPLKEKRDSSANARKAHQSNRARRSSRSSSDRRSRSRTRSAARRDRKRQPSVDRSERQQKRRRERSSSSTRGSTRTKHGPSHARDGSVGASEELRDHALPTRDANIVHRSKPASMTATQLREKLLKQRLVAKRKASHQSEGGLPTPVSYTEDGSPS